MSNQINDGGPAFGFASGDMVSLGMTLRDYFAAAALQGLLANHEASFDSRKERAEYCYILADAMLKAREAKP